MRLNIKDPIAISALSSVSTFIIVLFFFQCFQPSCVQKIDARGNPYVDTYLSFLYSVLIATLVGIAVIMSKMKDTVEYKIDRQTFAFKDSGPKQLPPSMFY